MQFAREAYSPELVSEMVPLWKEHYEETRSRNYGALDPDLSVYIALADQGALRIFTVREESRLSGYQVFFVSRHIHHRELIDATGDILFMRKALRRGMNGYRFLRYCVEKLSEEGIRVIHQRISARHDFGRLFERMGFELEDMTYSRTA